MLAGVVLALVRDLTDIEAVLTDTKLAPLASNTSTILAKSARLRVSRSTL